MPFSNKSELLNTNMHILYAAHVHLGRLWHAENISSPFTRVYMVTDGSGRLIFSDGTVDMRPGRIYVIPAGLTFSFSCEDKLSKTFFHISVPTPSGYDLLERLTHYIEFEDNDAVSHMTGLVNTTDTKAAFEIKSFLYSVLCRCAKEMDSADIRRYSPFVTDIMHFVEKNLSSSLTVDAIAKALLTSPAKIRKVFRAETGIPIGTYIYDRVLFSAEIRIRCTSLSVKEISSNLGFCDQFYFSRCFAKKYGLAPSKYRQKVVI